MTLEKCIAYTKWKVQELHKKSNSKVVVLLVQINIDWFSPSQ